jgi:hypothetical protein
VDLSADHAVAHVALGAEFSAATGWKKLGQPVPESNFTFERNNGSPQPMQA